MILNVTKVNIRLDAPEDGRRIATAEIELSGILTVRGFGIFPDGSGWGLKVYPPSGRTSDGKRIPLFETADAELGREVNKWILDAVDAEIKKTKEQSNGDG